LGNDELNQQSFDTQLLNNSHHDAENEMTAARFNVKRKAWIAAAERSQWVIEHYPQTYWLLGKRRIKSTKF
jgi:outer membrane protein assembly factor BamD (BamD/ComL family)